MIMNDKTTLKQAIDAAQEAYRQLEQALDSGDNRRIGAAMYGLKRALDEIQTIARKK